MGLFLKVAVVIRSRGRLDNFAQNFSGPKDQRPLNEQMSIRMVFWGPHFFVRPFVTAKAVEARPGGHASRSGDLPIGPR
jgi:hypothetical protein